MLRLKFSLGDGVLVKVDPRHRAHRRSKQAGALAAAGSNEPYPQG